MIDYLDEDVAYLIGLIMGRGQIVETDRHFLIRIAFPFHKPDLEEFDQFSGFVASIAAKILPRLKELIGTAELSVHEEKSNVSILAEIGQQNMIVRNIKMIMQNLDYASF